jgi:hypothetical protein
MSPKRILQHEFWPGPLRPTPTRGAVYGNRCLGRGPVRDDMGSYGCGQPTVNGESFCYRCKDPDGYADRLRAAQQEARQRCLEAYPVCKHCGDRLTHAQVEAGQTAHPRGSDGCQLPTPHDAMAQRREYQQKGQMTIVEPEPA